MNVGNYAYFLGRPTLAITSFAFTSFSGNRFLPLSFSKDLSIFTIGVLRLFNFSIVVITQNYTNFRFAKKASYSSPFSNGCQKSF